MQSRRFPMDDETRQVYTGQWQRRRRQQKQEATVRIGFEIRNRRFRFCRCDEYGTRPHGGGASGAARLSPLGRELILSKEMRLINAMYYKVPGIHEWDEYKQQLPSIQAHADAVEAALRRYRARRAERGMFELVPREDHPVGFRVVSPLYALPRHARARALRKLRAQQREKRRAAARQRQTQVERPMA